MPGKIKNGGFLGILVSPFLGVGDVTSAEHIHILTDRGGLLMFNVFTSMEMKHECGGLLSMTSRLDFRFSGQSLWTRYFQSFLDKVSEQDFRGFGFRVLDFGLRKFFGLQF